MEEVSNRQLMIPPGKGEQKVSKKNKEETSRWKREVRDYQAAWGTLDPSRPASSLLLWTIPVAGSS